MVVEVLYEMQASIHVVFHLIFTCVADFGPEPHPPRRMLQMNHPCARYMRTEGTQIENIARNFPSCIDTSCISARCCTHSVSQAFGRSWFAQVDIQHANASLLNRISTLRGHHDTRGDGPAKVVANDPAKPVTPDAAAKRAITQAVNAVDALHTVPAPLAAFYMLEGDHVSSHWTVPMDHVALAAHWRTPINGEGPSNVQLLQHDGHLVGVTLIDDYVHRGLQLRCAPH